MTRTLRLILASGSAARQAMLRDAGVSFDVIPADIDEYAIQDDLLAKGSGFLDVPEVLAIEKAKVISDQNTGTLVIGSDQILVCGDEVFTKAKTLDDARAKLLRLSGRTHHLMTGVALLKDGDVLWSYKSSCDLTMRDLDDALLDFYMAKAGDGLLSTVGAYEIEGLGAWLFTEMTGDSYSIRGMQLMPLLAALRKHKGVSFDG